jgi:HAD superfamily hydrolase (TIGR01509 family)
MSEPPLLHAVVFDLDGLMFNTEELYDDVGEILLQRRGCHYTGELKRAIMGRPARVGLKIMIEWHGLAATVEQLQTETDEIFAEILPTRLRALPGLEALLRALESVPVPKAIATSSGRAYTRTVLSQFDYGPRFQFVLTGEDVREGKPAPEVYLTAAERFGVPPSALLVLEDSENGCRAGVSAGAFTVAVPGPHSREHDFCGVALVANGLADPRIYRALGLAAPV